MKTTLLALSFSLSAQAANYLGTVEHFQGRYVESGAPYSYFAIKLEGDSKVALPDFIDGSKIPPQNQISFDGELVSTACTDMSSACIDAEITKLKSIQVTTSLLEVPMKTYKGKIQRLQGRAVESGRPYDYLALMPSRTEVPSFLNGAKLMKMKAKVETFGVLKSEACTDMSAACGPARFQILGGARVSL